MMKLNNLNIILIFVLVVLSVTLIVTVLRKKYNQNNNNISQGIENSINRLVGIKEGFQQQNGFNKKNSEMEDSTKDAINNGLKKKFESLKLNEENDMTSETYDNEDTSTSLDDMFTNLTNLETKCKEYEKKQQVNDDDEKKRHQEFVQEQLDIENVKINELTEIVNFYRKKYNEKMSVNSQCRDQKFKVLEDNITNLNKLQTDTGGALNEQELYLKFNNTAAKPETNTVAAM